MTEVLKINLWEYDEECSLCGKLGKHNKAIPYYEEPVATFEESEGGGKAVCNECYQKWDQKFHKEIDDVSESRTN